MKFSARHPWYTASIRDWEFIRACLAGESMESYLSQGTLETKAEFQARQNLAARLWRNYPAMASQLWSSILFKKAPARTLPDRLAPLLANCDRQGTDANPFFQRVAQDALAFGASFVIVDVPAVGAEGPPKTEAERLARGVWPYFVSFTPHDVLDWDVDSQGRLRWVALRDSYTTGENKPFEEKKKVEAVLVLDATSWQRWIEVNGQLEPVGDGTHNFGEIPLIPFYSPGKLAPMQATPPLKPICDLSVELLQTNSLLATALALFGVPRLCISSESQKASVPFSPTNALAALPGESADYVVLPAHAISGLLNAASQLKRDIRDHTHRRLDVRLESAAGETAEKVRLDNQHLHAFLAAFANSVQEGETRCWQLAARALGIKADRVSVVYEQRFDTRPAGERLQEALQAMALDVPSPTFRRQYLGDLASSLLPDAPPEVVAQVVAELEQAEGV